MGFGRVQDILNAAMVANQVANGDADLTVHDTLANPSGTTFSWASKVELLKAYAFGKQLIQPELIGAPDVSAVNLIVDLRTGFNNKRMPFEGPYVSEAEIQEIEAWIRDRCPD